jgi:hypothetical protein
MNLKYSFKDFTGQDLSGEPAEDFTGIIKGSCFAQEYLDGDLISDSGGKTIFPAITGVEFVGCNLDNVYVPPGNTVTGGVKRTIKADSNGVDKIMEKNGEWAESLEVI